MLALAFIPASEKIDKVYKLLQEHNRGGELMIEIKCIYSGRVLMAINEADLNGADLRGAYLRGADLSGASLRGASLSGASLSGADLKGTKGLVKIMGVSPGNVYWKRFGEDLINNGFQFFVGLNKLREGEIFSSDDRILCSCPGFHFASRSWCEVNYSDRRLEARIRIPEDAQINEPWATDGKASADKIEILQVFDTVTGEEVTDKYRRGYRPEQAVQRARVGVKTI